MDPLLLATIGLPLTIVILVIIDFINFSLKRKALPLSTHPLIILPDKQFPNFTKNRRY